MNAPSGSLSNGLDTIASRVESVDLYSRSLNRSRQIGRRRAAGVTAAGAVLAFAAFGTWQLLPRPDGPPVTPASPTVTVSESPTATVAPSESPTANPNPSASVVPASAEDLKNQTLDVPPWPQHLSHTDCPTEHLVLKDGQVNFPATNLFVGLQKAISVDINNDGVPETIAALYCGGPGERRVTQVVAYRGPSGSLSIIGQVAGPIPDVGNQESYIDDIEAAAPGIRVRVGIGAAGTAPPTYAQVHQWRTFQWNGSAFKQTAGSTKFEADPSVADLSVTTGPLVFGTPVGNCRTGTITLTVTNKGPQPAADVTAALMHRGIDVTDLCPTVMPTQAYNSSLVAVPTIAPGATKTVTATIVVYEGGETPSGTTVDESWNYVQLRIGDLRYPGNVRFIVKYN
jgi:hypothetical protein